jgi:hypothetical protein
MGNRGKFGFQIVAPSFSGKIGLGWSQTFPTKKIKNRYFQNISTFLLGHTLFRRFNRNFNRTTKALKKTHC